MRFFLTHLGDNTRLILGYPWFAAMQPRINWARGWLDYSQLPIVLSTQDTPRAVSEVVATIAEIWSRRAEMRPAGDRQTIASKLAQRATPPTTKIPREYQRHAKVFSEQEAQRFPGPREWDHAIELKKDAPASLPGKIYALTQVEQKALTDFLKKHLAKGYIRPSKSPYAAPFFFIKKKSGELRPVQDYRKVNEWTIKNRYPLPLIPELINRVKGATLFSKFDVRWGYNNVRIKEGDEWKAAFITNQGLFEPRVMFFGLTNSPATFQTMMNAIFEEELREDWLTIYMDNILIHTASDLKYHRRRVHQVLDKLEQHDLFLKPEKCQFETRRTEFLGIILESGTVQMDPAKIKGVADWPPPKRLKDVRSFLGFTGFYWYFIPNYSRIARPLIELTRKAVPFHWGEEQVKAFETMKTLMCSKPVLHQADYTKPFFLSTDASLYGVGAVLSQEGELNPCTQKPRQHPIAYYSATLKPKLSELARLESDDESSDDEGTRNGDVYERELWAVVAALRHWRAHLAGTIHPVTILTDHANLTYWKEPKKVNRKVAHWFAELQDYNIQIKHVPGKIHAAADMLSRPPGVDKGEHDNEDLTVLPGALFIKLTTERDLDDEAARDIPRETAVHAAFMAQERYAPLMESWKEKFHIRLLLDPTGAYRRQWLKGTRVVVPPEDHLKRKVLQWTHDAPPAGHPGRDITIRKTAQFFWWPGLNEWVTEYVKGCAHCQQNKNLTHRTKVPLYKIPVPADAIPFEVVSMDLITQLPPNGPHDAILTIVDHGCSRAAVFLPCATTITGEGIACLYLEHVYRWFGLPSTIISDRDPRFTSHFARALKQRLNIHQNLSTAFHPQTDGLSERKNQWVEQFLRMVTTAQQDDWADWLPLATAVHNSWENATIKTTPMEVIMGARPHLDAGPSAPSNNQTVEERSHQIARRREQAIKALNAASDAHISDQFGVGDRVWLEARNLTLPYPTAKLAPRRHGPFPIIKRVSAVAYQLQLPPTWTIHDVFHTSLLTCYQETPQHGPNYTRPPLELVEGEQEYEVETISGHRHFGKKRQLQYLIKWKGYPISDNTWEPSENVHAPELIRRYHERNPLGQGETVKKRQLRARKISTSHRSPTFLPCHRPLAPPSTATSVFGTPEANYSP